jgi:tetratricopeptide (TPR) repeat protein
LQSLESDPDNASCLLQYGNLLSAVGQHNDAEEFYKRASENTKGLKTMEWDYWGSPRSRELQTPVSPRLNKGIEKKRPKTKTNKKR